MSRMLRFPIFATCMWMTSLGLNYIHYNYCNPFLTLFEPCVSIQKGSMFLTKSLQQYGFLLFGMFLDASSQFIPATFKNKKQD